jgi:hypothetical protein
MVVKLPWAVGVAAIWLAAVAGVSVTASVAIDRAGRDVSGADVASRRPETPGSAVTTTIATADSPESPANATPKPPTSTSSPTRPTTRTPPSTSQPRPGIPNTPSPSSSNRPASTVRPPIPRSRTVSVTGGQVTARCSGAAIWLRIAQPDNGWRVEVEQSGPAEVEVSFRRGDADARVRTDVTAVCAAGAPTFTVENKT